MTPTMATHPYRNPELSTEARVDDLLARMTIEEKTDQLIQIPLGQDENPNNVGEGRFRPTVGSILASRRGAAAHNHYQRIAVEDTRLGIPILFGQDVIHGCYTIVPHSIGQACTFDPELVRKAAGIAAREARSMGYHWTFSPMIDVARDPRWGRVVEGYGEDPYLNAVFGAATVRGYQGDGLTSPESVAACLKHFVGYGAGEGGRDYSYTDVSRRALWETYLPPYKAGVEAGAATVMSSFNDITGVPAVANRYTMTEVLRNRFGFDGFVVSDWAAVSQLEAQGFSADPAVQTARCLEAGNDMDMSDQVYANIPELVADGTLDARVVDEAVRRVLRVKFRLGLFENPYFEEKDFGEVFLLPEFMRTAEDLAAESCVLLKNAHSVLPLAGRGGGTEAAPTIALIGPAADDRDALLGSWRCHGRAEDAVSILAGLRDRGADVRHARGCDYEGDDRSGFADAARTASGADAVVLCLGEPSDWTGENASRAEIELPEVQTALLAELAEALSGSDTPIVLVLVGGRPLGLQREEPLVDAILQAWQPGTAGGAAIADVLLGRRNPSGKLAISFPRSTGHIPTYYCEHSRARPSMGLYRGVATDALFEFGHGLTYTEFEYGEISLSTSRTGRNAQPSSPAGASDSKGQTSPPGASDSTAASPSAAAGGVNRADQTVTAEVEVRNTGDRDGVETVLWYVRDLEASLTQPIRRLVSFERVAIPSGGSARVRLTIDPREHLSYPDHDGNRILEPGTFIIEASRRVSCRLTIQAGE